MNKSKTVPIGHNISFCNELTLLFGISSSEIKNKYTNLPICLMDYYEKGIEEKAIEIRFDEEELTVTCTFNEEDSCDLIYLFPDKNKLIKELIANLNEAYEFDFIKSRWIASGYFIKVNEVFQCPNDIYFLLYK